MYVNRILVFIDFIIFLNNFNPRHRIIIKLNLYNLYVYQYILRHHVTNVYIFVIYIYNSEITLVADVTEDDIKRQISL